MSLSAEPITVPVSCCSTNSASRPEWLWFTVAPFGEHTVGRSYATWAPLSVSSDEMTIHRWYGIYFDRDPECSACGDFWAALAANYGLDLASVDKLPALPRMEQ